MALKIHTDPSIQRPDLPLAPMLHGLFRDVHPANRGTSWEQRFVDWWRIAPEHVELVPLADAQVAVLALDWYWVRGPSWRSRADKGLLRGAKAFAEKVRATGKPLLIFFAGDRSHETLPVKDAIVFREGSYRSRRGPRDFAMPGFSEDLVEHFFGGVLPLRPWASTPVVGFCGLAGSRKSWLDKCKAAVYHGRMLATQRWLDVSPTRGENLRAEALEILAQAQSVRTNILIRSAGVFFREAAQRDLIGVRSEYVSNLEASDYVLCCRGSGNYSYRLYETLCMGRIPVFIDTDCVLPCETTIDWKQHCVWVEEGEVGHLPEKVRDFHQSLGPARFRDLQRHNREVWLRQLAPGPFYANLHRLLDL